MVALPYTLPDYLIPDLNDNLRTFQLMQDIGGLFMAIHRLPEAHPNQCTYGAGINGKEFVNCAEGLELCDAIKVLSRYPKVNMTLLIQSLYPAGQVDAVHKVVRIFGLWKMISYCHGDVLFHVEFHVLSQSPVTTAHSHCHACLCDCYAV